jgi:hypothetical protein
MPADRTDLLYGPYRPPPLRRGDRVFCLYRDCDVVITGGSDARIPWPLCRRVGRPGHPGTLVEARLPALFAGNKAGSGASQLLAADVRSGTMLVPVVLVREGFRLRPINFRTSPRSTAWRRPGSRAALKRAAVGRLPKKIRYYPRPLGPP